MTVSCLVVSHAIAVTKSVQTDRLATFQVYKSPQRADIDTRLIAFIDSLVDKSVSLFLACFAVKATVANGEIAPLSARLSSIE